MKYTCVQAHDINRDIGIDSHWAILSNWTSSHDTMHQVLRVQSETYLPSNTNNIEGVLKHHDCIIMDGSLLQYGNLLKDLLVSNVENFSTEYLKKLKISKEELSTKLVEIEARRERRNTLKRLQPHTWNNSLPTVEMRKDPRYNPRFFRE